MAYSDGLVEAANGFGREWGVEGVLEAAKDCGTPSSLVRHVMNACRAFAGERQADDVTAVAVRIN